MKKIACLFLAVIFAVISAFHTKAEDGNLINVENPTSANKNIWSYSDGI